MTDWRQKAACIGTDPESFFPVNEEGTNPGDQQLIAQAKAVCGGCTVRAQCLEFALAQRSTHGVWAGTTGEQRRRLIHRGKAAMPKPPPDTELVERARKGLPVQVAFVDRRRIIAQLPDVPEFRLARAFNVSDKTIYNDRAVLRGETPWQRQKAAS